MLACPGELLVLKAIYSRSLKSAQDTAALVPGSHGPVDLYSDDSGDGRAYSDLLQRPDITGVIIALPILTQLEFIKAALLAGKHVLAEKPIGPTVASAQELVHWYKGIKADKGSTWAVAENFRFTEKYQWAAQEARKLGTVTGCMVKVLYMVKQGAPPQDSPNAHPGHLGSANSRWQY